MIIKVLGINSGLGVSLYPFRPYLIGNIETRRVFHTKKDEQWQSNFTKPLHKDFRTGIEWAKTQKPNVVIGSPDCGAGSVLRYSRAKELGDNNKNKSLLEFIEGVKTLKPKFFLFENLEGLFKSFKEKKFDKVFKKYHLIKYNVPVSVFGNSQTTRKRLVVVGIRKSLPEQDWNDIFSIDPELNNPKTCDRLYGDLMDFTSSSIGHVRELPGNSITMYAGYKITIAEATRHWQTELEGKRRWEVKGRKFINAPGVYRNRAEDFPNTARKASRQFDHHGKMLTPRQLARIQGVPDSFKIFISESNLGYWINKGRLTVTKSPPMEISTWFRDCLERYMEL